MKRKRSAYSLSAKAIQDNMDKASEICDTSGSLGALRDLLQNFMKYDLTKMTPYTPGMCNYKYIQGKAEFLDCIEVISKEKVIGVDLENNN